MGIKETLTKGLPEQKKNLFWNYLKIAALAVGAAVVINLLAR